MSTKKKTTKKATTANKVAKKREEKIKSILGFEVKSTLKTAMIYEDKFGYDMVNDTIELKKSLIESEGLDPSIPVTSLIRLLYSMVATANEEYLTVEGYNKFLDSVALNEINNHAYEIIALTLLNAQTGEEEIESAEEEGK